VGDRAERFDRDYLAGNILEFLQALLNPMMETTSSVPS
jgi:hypothetical protein